MARKELFKVVYCELLQATVPRGPPPRRCLHRDLRAAVDQPLDLAAPLHKCSERFAAQTVLMCGRWASVRAKAVF